MILNVHAPRTTYIADGSNEYLNTPGVRDDLNHILGITPVPIEFRGQSGIDHCGIPAILIALELMRWYKSDSDEVPAFLKGASWIRSKLKRWLHKEPSWRVDEFRQNIRNREFLRCPKCNWSCLTTKRTRLVQHVRFSKNK